ncbi:MAG: hypothetical protein AB7E32_07130 [Desulfovibrio sp.]
MKRSASSVFLSALFLALLFVATPAQALEFTVSASSEFMPLFGSFGPENLLDGDPDTAWAEGVEGGGAGEWVLFEFGRELLVERMGVRNGPQDSDNHPEKLRFVFSDGSEQSFALHPGAQWQMVEVGKRTASVRMVIESVLPGSALRYNRTSIADVSFELALPPGAASLAGAAPPESAGEPKTRPAPANTSATNASGLSASASESPGGERSAASTSPTAPETTPDTTTPDTTSPVADQTQAPVSESASPEATVARPAPEKHQFSLGDLFGSLDGPEFKPVDIKAMSGMGEPASAQESAPESVPESTPETVPESAPETASAEQPASPETPERTPLEELPRVDVAVMAGERRDNGALVAGIEDQEAVRAIIRAYFTKLVTLDDGYLELYVAHAREEEGFMFEYFKELQRQRHVYHLFRSALVDTAGLRFGPALVEGGEIRLEVDGSYTIYVADTYEDMSVHTLFRFAKEEGEWRIRAAEDLEEAPAQ